MPTTGKLIGLVSVSIWLVACAWDGLGPNPTTADLEGGPAFSQGAGVPADLSGTWTVAGELQLIVPAWVAELILGIDPEGPMTHIRCTKTKRIRRIRQPGARSRRGKPMTLDPSIIKRWQSGTPASDLAKELGIKRNKLRRMIQKELGGNAAYREARDKGALLHRWSCRRLRTRSGHAGLTTHARKEEHDEHQEGHHQEGREEERAVAQHVRRLDDHRGPASHGPLR